MLSYIKKWFERQFSDPQVNLLTVLLVMATLLIVLLGKMLAPVIAALVIAYLLEGLVMMLTRRGVPRSLAVYGVFTVFLAGFLFVVLALIPLVYRQMFQLLTEIPNMVQKGQEMLLLLPERYPNLFTETEVRDFMQDLRGRANRLAEWLVSYSLSSIPVLVVLVVYLVLIPVTVLFFLKDKNMILNWCAGYLPEERALANQVWRETNRQIANYIRGKFWEIIIVGVFTYAVFLFLGLEYAALLSVLVGVSVLIPYIGAILVTFPIALVAFFQWNGFSVEFMTVLIAYAIIQALDANVLVPILFSKVVNLHPVAIIIAVLFFGSIWGFWGLFFAIPLATLIQAVLTSWPRNGTVSGLPQANANSSDTSQLANP